MAAIEILLMLQKKVSKLRNSARTAGLVYLNVFCRHYTLAGVYSDWDCHLVCVNALIDNVFTMRSWVAQKRGCASSEVCDFMLLLNLVRYTCSLAHSQAAD